MEVKVHKKGIIVLPAEIRKKLDIREGSLLSIKVEGDTIVLKKEVTMLEAYGSIGKKEDAEELIRELHEMRRKEVESDS
ncbi:AbrB/MazE/SpoVT family DNA-binding domain-containing protein [Sulfurisphaera javensis]|uniref:AbrB/MazE/SpoVT family DNA-binding domain-containing protein n=1 Tax=Sulfurisphaera javensis TaxID=2049879 RepID=A0AAT9GTJ1_9CREN